MSENVTKEGILVEVGQRWQDLDKRMNGRTRAVIAVEGGKAHLDGYPKTKIAISRMHKGSSGWALVQGANGKTTTVAPITSVISPDGPAKFSFEE